MPALVGEKFVLADEDRFGRRQEGSSVHLGSMVREEPHLGVVLRMDEIHALLVDDVVQHLEVGRVTREWHEVPAVSFGAHEQELVGVGADEVEGLGGKS